MPQVVVEHAPAPSIPESVAIQGKEVEIQSMPRAGSPRAGAILDKMVEFVKPQLHTIDITVEYFEDFILRHRVPLLQLIDQKLAAKEAKEPTVVEDETLPPDEWTKAARTAANLRAMEIVAKGGELTAEERAQVGKYSGWGGLDNIESLDAQGAFPSGFPKPEMRGLIHEYYTPTKLCLEVARICQPLLANLPHKEGQVLALEPAAGIGRFVRAFTGNGFRQVNWTVVEWSEISGRMLQAMRPDLAVFNGPFERWVIENGPEYDGNLGLIVSNPPYGARSGAITEDPDRSYRTVDSAYGYFMRRGLDLLARWGLGVYIVPYGFMSGQSSDNQKLRDLVLRRHHLACAFRLPSALFPGALIVVDLIFFRGRGGELEQIPKDDQFILDGEYFKKYPKNILGEEVGNQHDQDITGAKPRWGYQVTGEFTGLPKKLKERPIKADLVVRNYRTLGLKKMRQGGVARKVKTVAVASLDLRTAIDLGERADDFLAAKSANEKLASELWFELHEQLVGWVKLYGNPHKNEELVKLAKDDEITYAQRFLAVFQKNGQLIDGMKKQPLWAPSFVGSKADVLGQADFLYRAKRSLTPKELHTFHKKIGGRLNSSECVKAVLAGDWALDGETWNELMPPDIYYTGWVKPRLLRAQARWEEKGDEQAKHQAEKIKDKLDYPIFDEIRTLDPRQGWIPLVLISEWINTHEDFGIQLRPTGRAYNTPVLLYYANGLYQISFVWPEYIAGYRPIVKELPTVQLTKELTGHQLTFPYDWMTGTQITDLGRAKGGHYAEYERDLLNLVGYMNYDMKVFKPEYSKKHGPPLEVARFRRIKRWKQEFAGFLAAEISRQVRVEEAYTAHFSGWIQPTYSAEPLPVARWTGGIKPHPHQAQGARRLLENRGGLLAYDVGVGKTFTAILAIAKGRQDGFIKRPLLVVPNTLVWKWQVDFRKCVPDYRVVVLGAKKKLVRPRAQLDFNLPKAQRDLLEEMCTAGILAYPATAGQINKLVDKGLMKESGELTEDGLKVAKSEEEQKKLSKSFVELIKALQADGMVAKNKTLLAKLEANELIHDANGSRLPTEKGLEVVAKIRARTVSVTDTPEERARKWTEFQAGMWDAAIITFSSFPRTRMDLKMLTHYADHHEAIKHEIALYKRNLEQQKERGKKELTPRQEAILKEGTAKWVALKTELPEAQDYDPGIDFNDLGIDWIVVDEAQNFKNLYGPANREGGAPAYMGSGASSKRAWNMDFRTYSIQQHTGGTGVCLLSATPAKNSPLEFYNVLQYIDHKMWEKRGIKNPEQFIDRYLNIQLDDVLNTVTLEIDEDRAAVKGFMNLDELRDIIYRYGDFRTADEAGIDLPEVPEIPPQFVKMDALQQEKYKRYRAEARNAKQNPELKHKLLGILSRMSSVAIHANLDEGFNWKTAKQEDPFSPKIDAVAKNVCANPNCGHIIFVENLAAQVWMGEWLIEKGISKARIAYLNAEVAKGSATRQRIARYFNGGLNDEDLPDDTVEPRYDVVIANQVAYEGIDLQRRTCEIHHLDLPWEPATLEQRNGRGVRQGNILGAVAIRYYMSEKSMDLVRYSMILGKHGWMKTLLESTDRVTMNPAAQSDIDAGYLHAMLADDPEAALEEWKAGEEERKRKKRFKRIVEYIEASRNIASLFWRARWMAKTTEDAERYRKRAERALKELEEIVDPEVWPFLPYLYKARDHDVIITSEGPALWAGARIALPDNYDTRYYEIGRAFKSSMNRDVVSYREARSPVWKTANQVGGMFDIAAWKPENIEPSDWPEETDKEMFEQIKEGLQRLWKYDDPMVEWNWAVANNAWLERFWPKAEPFLRERWEMRYGSTRAKLPVVIDGQLDILEIKDMKLQEGGRITSDRITFDTATKDVIPPTFAGWNRFIELAIDSKFKVADLFGCTQYWWGRAIPSGIITRGRAELIEKRKAAKAAEEEKQ